MNRRQKKKAYKKKHGNNPPKTEVKYYGKKWGKVVNRAMDGIAEVIRTAIPVICKVLEDAARLALQTTTRIQTMPEEEFNRFLENPDFDEEARKLAKRIRRKGHNELHTTGDRKGNERENTAAGMENNTGLYGSR